jgi:hypothetical protein
VCYGAPGTALFCDECYGKILNRMMKERTGTDH